MGGFSDSKQNARNYFWDGAATAFATGVAGDGALLLVIVFMVSEVVFCEKVTVDATGSEPI